MELNEETFTLNVTAESGENYPGSFTIYKRLSHLQRLRKEELQRQLIGGNAQYASEDAIRSSYILATVAVYVKKGPKWFSESNSGQTLTDEEPLVALFERIDEVVKATDAKRNEQAKAAKEVIQ